MRKMLLWIAAMLFCLSVTAGYSGINTEQEEPGIIEYEYDELNRVIRAVYPDGTTLIYQYDKNGNLLETVVLPPEENGSAGEGTDQPEGDHSGTEVSGEGMMNTEYTYESNGDHYDGNSSNPGQNGWADSDGQEKDTDQSIEAGGQEELLPEEGTQRMENKQETRSEESGFPWGWILAAASAAALTGGAVWRNRRRKQDED